MTTARVKHRRQPTVATTLCKYCHEPIARRRGAMMNHLLTCEAAPGPESEGELPAGTILGQGTGAPRKTKWTRSKFLEAYPQSGWRELIPPRNQRIEALGQVFIVMAGVPIKLPAIHYDIYMQSLASDRDITSPRQPSDYYSRTVPYEGATGLQIVGVGPLREER